jgi:hypothetical protein
MVYTPSMLEYYVVAHSTWSRTKGNSAMFIGPHVDLRIGQLATCSPRIAFVEDRVANTSVTMLPLSSPPVPWQARGRLKAAGVGLIP